MSYGSNQPWGLQATRTITGATWNGAVNTYLIPSGYAQNIFRGDLVAITNTGYIVNLADVAGFGDKAAVGVFNGCSYVTPTSVNPIDPASPGRPFWPSGTNTLNAVPAVAYVIDDPMVVYNVQTNNAAGLAQSNMLQNFSVAYTLSGGQVQGNVQTGVSVVTLDQGTAAANAALNLITLRLVPYPNNLAGIPYNNAEVLISNHQYCQRAAGHA